MQEPLGSQISRAVPQPGTGAEAPGLAVPEASPLAAAALPAAADPESLLSELVSRALLAFEYSTGSERPAVGELRALNSDPEIAGRLFELGTAHNPPLIEALSALRGCPIQGVRQLAAAELRKGLAGDSRLTMVPLALAGSTDPTEINLLAEIVADGGNHPLKHSFRSYAARALADCEDGVVGGLLLEAFLRPGQHHSVRREAAEALASRQLGVERAVLTKVAAGASIGAAWTVAGYGTSGTAGRLLKAIKLLTLDKIELKGLCKEARGILKAERAAGNSRNS